MASNKSKLETPEYKARLLAFSERLKTERDKLGITQALLAKRSGLSGHAVISRWEAVADETRGGEYSSAGAVARELPDVNDILKLCDVFGCDIAYLVGIQEKPTKPLTDICAATGLSAQSVKSIIAVRDSSVEQRERVEAMEESDTPLYTATPMDLLNSLLESETFFETRRYGNEHNEFGLLNDLHSAAVIKSRLLAPRFLPVLEDAEEQRFWELSRLLMPAHGLVAVSEDKAAFSNMQIAFDKLRSIVDTFADDQFKAVFPAKANLSLEFPTSEQVKEAVA